MEAIAFPLFVLVLLFIFGFFAFKLAFERRIHKPIEPKDVQEQRKRPEARQTMETKEADPSPKAHIAPSGSELEPPHGEPRRILNDGVDIKKLLSEMNKPSV